MEWNQISGGVCAPKGFVAGGIHCGLSKRADKKDLALIFSQTPCTAAAVYTQNKVKGAPIAVTKANLESGIAHAVICNSTNANTCNGDGEEKAKLMCHLAAKSLGIAPQQVIVASTGVIGRVLPIEPIAQGMPQLAAALSPAGSNDAASAIMTTDLRKKELAISFDLGGKACTLGGISKGSGMIHPNMATMLAFLTTDVAISTPMLQKALLAAVSDTFNMVSVDGDTSTNDMCSVMASGLAGNATIESENDDYHTFVQALTFVSQYLAKEIAADGEGATKLLECKVFGAPTKACARSLAKSVITSSLLKAAMFGEDANWGRVLCALGYADAEFDIGKVSVSFVSAAGSVEVCKDGAGVDFSEEVAKTVLQEHDIGIHVQLFQGEEDATAWGCDLSYDYVKINGDYRS